MIPTTNHKRWNRFSRQYRYRVNSGLDIRRSDLENKFILEHIKNLTTFVSID